MTLRRALRAAAALLVLLLIVAAVAATASVTRGLPVLDGEARIAGLERNVEIVRDGAGVPHVSASTTHDMFFTQGFVTAQDRLFQMDLNRRVARGRLAEVLGEPALETDRYLRTIGLGRLATSAADRMDPITAAAAEAYAAGVNAFIGGHLDRLPLEFLILGYRPEAWVAADSVAVGKLQALDLDGDYTAELFRAAVIQRLGEAALPTLTAPAAAAPAGLADGTWAAVAPLFRTGSAVARGLEDLRSYLGETEQGLGSNCWAVARGKSGKPLFAGDPHLGVRNPSVWYEVGLEGPGYKVAGFSFPGVPGVVVGHNERIAWSFTVAYVDTQDLYVEQQDPQDFRRYLFRGTWERASVVREQIRVKGRADPVFLDVTVTRHGPILTPVLKGQQAQLALRWTALELNAGLDGVLALNRAGTFTEFRSALGQLPGPTVTGCYADVDGHIGWAHAGLLPIRAKGDGRLPVPGWTGDAEWTGFVPPAALPFVLDPPEGYVVSANDRLVGDPASPTYAGDWDRGYRAARIHALLRDAREPDAEAFRAIQNDVASAPAQRMREAILAARARSAGAASAQAVVREWNGSLDVDSAGAAIEQAWLVRMIERTFRDKLGDSLYADYLAQARWPIPALHALLARPADPWFTAVVDGQGAGRDELSARALDDAVSDLTARFGSDRSRWRWGALHTVVLAHPLSVVKPLDRLFDIGPLERPGDGYSVNQAAYALGRPFALRNHASARMIVDLGDLDASWSVLPTGESGQPFSRHWGDQTPLWAAGRLHPMGFTRDRLRDVEGILLLRPH